MRSLNSKRMRYVWAPDAKSVRLNVSGRLHRLTKTRSGWWIGEKILAHLDDYTFIIDGRRDLPDPRSRWQPHGVHGPSRFLDHGNYRWSDDGWRPEPWERAILYELHIGTFTSEGTFDAAIQRLDHLSRLGVTHIELLPVGQFPGDRGWGYDGVYPFAVQNSYGGPEMLKRFVDACHRQGLAVLLDVVYNHLGPSGNVLPEYGPYHSKTHSTPWGPGLNYDAAESDEVRRYVCDNALMWLRDYHIYLNHVGANLAKFIDAFGERVLPQLTTGARS